MLDVLNQDFIRTARAKGVSDPPVVWKHALKNAAIPIVTIVGIELGTLLGGSVITETIFAWPGVGRLSVQAIYNRDYPVVQAAVFLLALTAPFVSPFDPLGQDLENRLKAPGWQDGTGHVHPLGTDHLGRDILARVIFGARPALLVGVAAVLISGVLGMVTGLLSGYFGGRVDDVLMRLADIQLAFPFILLAIAVIGVLGPSLFTIIAVIGVSSWVIYARVVRGAVDRKS